MPETCVSQYMRDSTPCERASRGRMGSRSASSRTSSDRST